MSERNDYQARRAEYRARNERIAAMYAEGVSMRRIAAAFDICPMRVHQILKRTDVHRRTRTETNIIRGQALRERARALAEVGHGASAIQRALGCSSRHAKRLLASIRSENKGNGEHAT